MTPDMKRILDSKRKLRRHLATRPIAEKLAMLDALRERSLLLRGASRTAAVNEAAGEYGKPAKNLLNRPGPQSGFPTSGTGST
jgi:hypothetical protein